MRLVSRAEKRAAIRTWRLFFFSFCFLGKDGVCQISINSRVSSEETIAVFSLEPAVSTEANDIQKW
jgi:hypothetical protein